MSSSKRVRPRSTPEGRESQLIALALDQAEQQLMAGTASAAVVTHYLKLATTKEQLEKAKLEAEVRLIEAKIEAAESAAKVEELYKNALEAMSLYKGTEE